MKTKVMTKRLAWRWVKALRSGDFEPGKRALKRRVGNKIYYCPLGVAMEVCGIDRDLERLHPHALDNRFQRNLTNMNDTSNYSFDEIATYIEKEVIPTLPERQP